MIIRTVAILILLLSVTEGGQSIIGSPAPDFALQDQYDRPFTLRQYEGRVVVFLASDKEGSTQNQPWEKAISERYGNGVSVYGIADVRSVPFFLKGRIKSDFKKNKDGILLDWKGDVFKAYGLAEKVSNVILIDKYGVVRYVYSGAATEKAVERLFSVIDKLR